MEKIAQALSENYLNYWWISAGLILLMVYFLLKMLRNETAKLRIPIKLYFIFCYFIIIMLYYFTPMYQNFIPSIVSSSADIYRYIMVGVFGFIGLLFFLDMLFPFPWFNSGISLPATPLKKKIAVIGILFGLFFQIWELAGGNVFPAAQAYGLNPIPLLMVSGFVVAGSRPMSYTGRVLTVFLILVNIYFGIFHGILIGQYHLVIASFAGIVMAALLFDKGASVEKASKIGNEEPVEESQ